MHRNVWILNPYPAVSFFSHGGRHYWIAKYLKQEGYSPVVFMCNTKHGVKERYLDTTDTWTIQYDEEIQVPYVMVNSVLYEGNGIDRVLNMTGFYFNVKKACRQYARLYGKPDIMIASSVHPLTLVAGIRLAKHFGVKCICEMRDLWPESIVAIGLASETNLLVRLLYKLEKWTCKHCDALITTIEGGYDYFTEKGYTKLLPRNKFYYLNNGIDLDEFRENVKRYTVDDPDLNNDTVFKVVYTGSLRLANGPDRLLGCARELKKFEKIQFLVYGAGNCEEELQNMIKRENLTNVHFKGSVEKKYIPYILSKSSLNMLNYNTAAAAAALYKYGSSQNKLFEYLASGKPVISNGETGYDIIIRNKCGIAKNIWDDKTYAAELLKIYNCSPDEYKEMCSNSGKAAAKFDFKNTTKKLTGIIEKVAGNGKK